MFGSVGGPTKTTVVEGLVIPACLDTVQATNFVLTQQVGGRSSGNNHVPSPTQHFPSNCAQRNRQSYISGTDV